jgi:hypothetical protein
MIAAQQPSPMIAAQQQRIAGPDRGSPVVIGLLALSGLALVTFLFVTGAYPSLVYVVIAATSLVAFAAPARWGIAALLFFGGIGGILKDVAAYETIAHLGNDFVLISLLLGHGARALLRREPMVPDFPFKRLIGFLLVVAAFMTFLPITRPLIALGGWKGYVIPALVAPVAYLGLRQKGSSRPLVGAIVITAIGNAIASLVEQALGPNAVAAWGPGFVHNIASYTFAFDTASNLVWRPFGLAQGAGEAAVIEVLGATILMYVAFGKRPMIQWIAGLGAFLCAVAVLESSVRTAILMLLVGFLGCVVMRGGRRPSGLLVGLLVLAVVGGSFYFVLKGSNAGVQGRIAGLFTTTTYLTSRGGVYSLIGEALLHLPLGIGMGRVTPGSDVLASLAGVANDGAATENVLLAMMYELGWAGLLFVVILFWKVGAVVREFLLRNVDDREGGLAAVLLMVMFVAGLSGPTLISQPDNLYIWIFATLAYLRYQEWQKQQGGGVLAKTSAPPTLPKAAAPLLG